LDVFEEFGSLHVVAGSEDDWGEADVEKGTVVELHHASNLIIMLHPLAH